MSAKTTGFDLSNIPSIDSSSNSSTRSGVLNNLTNLSSRKSSLLLPWDRFSYWVHSILVVTFDIEMGQSLESIYPSSKHVKLTQNEKTNICYMSFPDSNSGFLGDTQYHFRFLKDSSSGAPSTVAQNFSMQNHNTVASNLNNLPQANFASSNSMKKKTTFSSYDNYLSYNRKTINGLEVDLNHMFGYVFFRQVKDKSLKRGYFQKSVVLLSKFPFVSFFNYILSLIANEYFTTGGEVLETACNDIDNWPLPVPGEHLSLPILGHVIELCLPVKLDNFKPPIIFKKESPSIPVSLPAVHELNLFKSLQPIVVYVHLLWELVLLNEPVVVIANVPNVCSELVQALISLIWPLKYSSDYRPYFTIHNTEFNEYSAKSSTPPGYIIGVTNPFFTKCLQHWPNIIKIGDPNKPAEKTSERISTQFFSPVSSSSASSNKASKIKKTSSIRVVDSKPAVYTRYESFLSKDKEILKSLLKVSIKIYYQ